MNSLIVNEVAQNTQDLLDIQAAQSAVSTMVIKDIELARVGGGDALYTW